MRRISAAVAPLLVLLWIAASPARAAELKCYDGSVVVRPGVERDWELWCSDATAVEVAVQPAAGHVSIVGSTVYGPVVRVRMDADAPREDGFALRLTDRHGSADVPILISSPPPSENTAPDCWNDTTVERTSGASKAVVWLDDVACGDPEYDPFVMVGNGPGRHLSSPLSVDPAHPSETQRWLYETSITSGTEHSSYYATDALGARSPTRSITVTVGPAVDNPAACYEQTIAFRPGVARHFAVGCDDADGDAFGLRVDTPPTHGTITRFEMSPYNPIPTYRSARVTYEPGDGLEDSFKIAATRAGAPTVRSTIELVPLADEENTTPHCDPPDGRAYQDNRHAIGFRCYDDEGDRVTASVKTAPAHGTLSKVASRVEDDGTSWVSASFVPDAGYVGEDYAELSLSDGRATFTIEVPIVVRPLFTLSGPSPPAPMTGGGAPATTPAALARRALRGEVKLLRKKGDVRVYAAKHSWATGLKVRRGARALAITCPALCKLATRVRAGSRTLSRDRAVVVAERAALVTLSRTAAARLRKSAAKRLTFSLTARDGRAERSFAVRLRTRR